jgi:hypothetical protein
MWRDPPLRRRGEARCSPGGSSAAARTCARVRRRSPVGVCSVLRARRHEHVHLPRPRGGARHGRSGSTAASASCSGAPGGCAAARAVRCTWPISRSGSIGSNAIVGGHLPTAVGRRLGRPVPGDRCCERRILRRRGDEHRRISRELQPGGGLEASRSSSCWRTTTTASTARVASTTPVERLARPGRELRNGGQLRWTATTCRPSVRRRGRRSLGRGPGAARRLIEADTYRQQGHSRSDPASYRPEGELDAWVEVGPDLPSRPSRWRPPASRASEELVGARRSRCSGK